MEVIQPPEGVEPYNDPMAKHGEITDYTRLEQVLKSIGLMCPPDGLYLTEAEQEQILAAINDFPKSKFKDTSDERCVVGDFRAVFDFKFFCARGRKFNKLTKVLWTHCSKITLSLVKKLANELILLYTDSNLEEDHSELDTAICHWLHHDYRKLAAQLADNNEKQKVYEDDDVYIKQEPEDD